mgnify:CR=1 FL=1
MDESDTNQEKAGSHANTTTSTCGDGKLYWNPRLRKDMPPLREDSEFVDLSHLEAMKAPIYECTHSYVDKIVLKCNSCSRWAVGTSNVFSMIIFFALVQLAPCYRFA